MSEYEILTNRLEKVKRIQQKYINYLSYMESKKNNDFYYGRFVKACSIGNNILERMVNLIIDKEGVK